MRITGPRLCQAVPCGIYKKQSRAIGRYSQHRSPPTMLNVLDTMREGPGLPFGLDSSLSLSTTSANEGRLRGAKGG